MEERTPPLLVVVGPTASGKSGLAHGLARTAREWAGRSAQIVSVDAFALYRGMDIGTAKPSLKQRQEIIYHQIDQLDISQVASVATFQRQARADVASIFARHELAIAVGGSALYVRALVDEMEFPGSDPKVRKRLETQAEEVGASAMYERLAQLDPVAAQALHPHNLRRVIRALEVIEITGKPFTASLPKPRFVRPTIMVGVRRDLADLDARIVQRTQQMFEDGLVREVQALLDQGLASSVTASRAVGYREVMRHLRGEYTLAQAQEQVAVATRQLARRQLKWFRRDDRIHWLDASGLSGQELLEQAHQRLTDLMCEAD